jgi:hypothetical protein
MVGAARSCKLAAMTIAHAVNAAMPLPAVLPALGLAAGLPA